MKIPLYLSFMFLSLLYGEEQPTFPVYQIEHGKQADPLQLRTFFPKNAQIPDKEDFEANAEVKGTAEGIRIAMDIRDNAIVESPEKESYNFDSVELYFAAGQAGDEKLQLIIVPGWDPLSESFGKPVTHVFDRRKNVTEEVTYTVVTDSNDLKKKSIIVIVPWTVLGMTGESGEKFWMNISVNDRDQLTGGKRKEYTWFTGGWAGKGKEYMYPLLLGNKASSSPQLIAGSVLSPSLQEQKILILGDAELQGEQVQVMQNGIALKTLHLASTGSGQLAKFSIPLTGQADAPPYQVVFQGHVLHQFEEADISEKRKQALEEAEWEFTPVFSSTAFPAIELKNPGWMTVLMGDYELETTFYNSSYEEVAEAKEPGRYGAVTRFVREGSEPHLFYHTLYRTQSEKVEWRDTSVSLTSLPGSLEVPGEWLKSNDQILSRTMQWEMRNLITRDSFGAVLLAGISESIAEAESLNSRSDPYYRDEAWWLGLKKKVGLFQHRYTVDLPEGYEDKTKWPFILFLHGSGERGSDENPIAKHGPSKEIREGRPLPFIVINPQCEKGSWWTAARVKDLLDEVQEKYKIDPDQMYLTGLSMGGFGTWNMVSAHPDLFAAAAPICGGGTPEEADRLVNLPIWNFHGDADNAVDIDYSQKMVDAIREAGGEYIEFTIYPGIKHDSWTKTYSNPSLYAWFLANRRGIPPVMPSDLKVDPVN